MKEQDAPQSHTIPSSAPALAQPDNSVPPAWFAENIAAPFETLDAVLPDGRRIEARAWGRRGAPGLLFVHGNSAHLGWWSFLAPFFADRFRVICFSLGGMGQSDWRAGYSSGSFAEEMWAAADAGGLATADRPPVIVAHSMGGLPLIHSAARIDRPIRAGILIDVGLPGVDDITIPPYAGHRLYASEEAATGRFRLSPVQPCENRWVLDYLARMAVKPATDLDGASGWSWRFDPALWGGVPTDDIWSELRAMRCPVAVVRGARSILTGQKMMAAICDALPGVSPVITIPEAYHHVMIDQPIATVSVLETLFKTWLDQ